LRTLGGKTGGNRLGLLRGNEKGGNAPRYRKLKGQAHGRTPQHGAGHVNNTLTSGKKRTRSCKQKMREGKTGDAASSILPRKRHQGGGAGGRKGEWKIGGMKKQTRARNRLRDPGEGKKES